MLVRPSSPVDVVRLSTVMIYLDKRYSGTAFFVDDHTLVTCAHVVHGADGHVTVLWEGREFEAAIVVLIPNEPGEGDYYEFPDLAFLAVDDPPDHPGLRLTDSPQPPAVLTAVGYSEATPHVGVQPDELRLTVAGRSGQYLRVKDDEIVAGMSGAPAVDDRGAIHGVVKASRDYGRPRGGFIIPTTYVASLLREHESKFDRWTRTRPVAPRPDDLSQDGKRLRRLLSAQLKSAERMPYKLVDGPQPNLSAVYVEVRAERREPRTATAAATAVEDADISRQVMSVREMVRQQRHTLLVGGPGAGKSSLLLRIVGETAAWYLADRVDGEPPYGRVIPVRISATSLVDQRMWETMIADAIRAEMGSLLGDSVTADMFAAPPWPGLEWLLLVDGLDEIMDADLRQRLIESISFFMSGYGLHWRFLVASRSLLQEEFAGLRAQGIEVGTTIRFDAYELRPFDTSGLAAFAANWFAVREKNNAEERTASFLRQVSDSQLSHLVRVPLLATIAAIVYEQDPGDPLPVDRTGLYERFVHGLLYERPARRQLREDVRQWSRRHNGPAAQVAEMLFEESEVCLEEIAAQRLERDDEPDATGLAVIWLGERLRRLSTIPGLMQQVRFLLLNTGLLVAEWDRVDFVHRGFAEYLAAGRIVRYGFDSSAWLVRLRRQRIDNTSMFAFARWARDGNDPVPMLTKLLYPGFRFRFSGLLTLCALVEDGLPLPPDALRRLIDRTVWALRFTRLDDESVASILLSLSTRKAGTAALSRVAYGPLFAPRKRQVAARLLIDRSEAREQASAAQLLGRLGAARLSTNYRRSLALQTLVRVGDDEWVRHGVEALAREVERAPDETGCLAAVQRLLEIDGLAAAERAIVRRAARMDRVPDRVKALDLLLVLRDGERQHTAHVRQDDVDAVPLHLQPRLVGPRVRRNKEGWTYTTRPSSGPLLLPRGSRPIRTLADRFKTIDLPEHLLPPRFEHHATRWSRRYERDRWREDWWDSLKKNAGEGYVAVLLTLILDADLPAHLRAAALKALPQRGATAAGRAAAELVLGDSSTTDVLAVEVWRVLAHTYGDRAPAARGLLALARRSSTPPRTRLRAATAGAALRINPIRLRPALPEEMHPERPFEYMTSATRPVVDGPADGQCVDSPTDTTDQVHLHPRWRINTLRRSLASAIRVAVGDSVNAVLTLLAAYLTTAAVGAIMLDDLHKLTIIQAQISVPVLAAVFAFTVRPGRPARDLSAAGQLAPAAAVLVAASVWYDDARPRLQIWQPAADLLGPWNAMVPGRDLSVYLMAAAAGIFGLILCATVSARSRRTTATTRPRLWAVLRVAILLAATAYVFRGLHLHLADLSGPWARLP